MSDCIDPRFENMLHAYELGMMNDNDRREFELHLMECRQCFERAQKMQIAAGVMRSDPDLQALPGRIIDEQSEIVGGLSDRQPPSRSRKRFWPVFLPTSAVAAVIFVLLVLKPWQFEIRPSHDAVAVENRLAIMYFENLANPGDPQRLGEITANLLIVDLSESSYLQVISSQRLIDILRLLDKGEGDLADMETATRVASEAGARWMLTGSILQVEPQFILSTQLIEVATGIVIASERAAGEEAQDVFSLVDRLTVLVKNDLSLPMAAQQEPDRRVADVTTHSPLAYRYYLEGLVFHNRYYNADATESFRKALDYDSTFAMAYYYLSLIDDPSLIAEAVEYSDKASSREGYLIRSREAYLSGDVESAIRQLQEVLQYYPDDKDACYRLGIYYATKLEFETAISFYQRAVKIDPLYKTVYNQMAYTYDWMGDFERSIESIDMYISLAPQEPNPYDSRGDIYTRNGKLKLAIDSYLQALAIKPDFWDSLYKLGRNKLFLGEYAFADSCFRELSKCGEASWRPSGLIAMTYVPLSQGRFDEVIRLMNENIEIVRAERDERSYPSFFHLKAIAWMEKGRLSLALKGLEESVDLYRQQNPNDRTYERHLLAQFLAQSGNTKRAEEIAREFGEHLASNRDTLRFAYAVASIELAKGNLAQAVEEFQKAAEDSVIPYTPAHCMLGLALLESGDWTAAIAEFEKILSIYNDSRLFWGSWTAKAHYYIGIGCEELGNLDRAMVEYRLFLDLWKNADPDLAEIEDSKERLARLENKL